MRAGSEIPGNLRTSSASFVSQRDGRLRLGGSKGWINRRDEGENECGRGNSHHVRRMQLARDSGNVIDIRIHDVKAESAFQKWHDHIDVKGERQTQTHPERGA